MFDQAQPPIQLQLPGVPVPRRGLQEIAEAQRAFVAAFERYQQLLSERSADLNNQMLPL